MEKKGGQTGRGVMIILRPEITKTWARKIISVNFKLQLTFPGQMIGITLQFPNISNRKKINSDIEQMETSNYSFAQFIIPMNTANKNSSMKN